MKKITAESAKERVCPFRFYGTKSYHFQYCLGDNCLAWNEEEGRCELIINGRGVILTGPKRE